MSNLTSADIIQIIEVCARHSVSKFTHKEFKLEFNTETANRSIMEDVKASSLPLPKSEIVDGKSFTEQLEHRVKSEELELMAIENPGLYEDLLIEGDISEGVKDAELERSGVEQDL